ncbi:MAG: hypothetical protein JO051_07750 [Acidobacteriaceae bacterium]|nr:hypothetical protein [Acidobacteriaceae bacterium]
MPISKRKLAANRANAKKSRGPVTDAGKQKVSINAIQHGLCGRFRVLPDENQAEYDNLIRRFMEAEKPVDEVERELVAKMARHTWMSERSVRFQEACFLYQPQSPEEKANERQTVAVLRDLKIYTRYQAAHDRAYQRAANDLAKRRKDRASLERGIASQKRAEAEETRREKRQKQRDDLHPYKVLTAEMRTEQLAQRVLKAGAGFQAPNLGQIAA